MGRHGFKMDSKYNFLLKIEVMFGKISFGRVTLNVCE